MTNNHKLHEDILENIFQRLDTNSLTRSRKVCRYWKQTIDEREKLKVRRRSSILKQKLRLRKAIFHPDYIPMIDNILATSDENKISRLMGIAYEFFSEPILRYQRPPTEDNSNVLFFRYQLDLKDSAFVQLVFSDVRRLEFFFPFLPNKNPIINTSFQGEYTSTVIHFVAFMGWTEAAQFMMENLLLRAPISTNKDHHYTPNQLATEQVKKQISDHSPAYWK